MADNRFDLLAAPMHIGKVRLKVRDLTRVAAFYREIIGLGVLAEAGDQVTLGAGDRALLELVGDATLAPRDPGEAGLFHTAFLLPGRQDLGRWLGFIADRGVPLDGASDHIVSEAIYLADPEGNGIEVYADRPVEAWKVTPAGIVMTTDPLDMDSLIAAGSGQPWQRAPDGTIVGHIHLQVGSTDIAEGFYRDALGLDLTYRYPGGSFFGAGGYHHQIAGNVWHSRGAGLRAPDEAGLARFEIVLRDDAIRSQVEARLASAGITPSIVDDGLVVRDPWGTEIALVPAMTTSRRIEAELSRSAS